MSRAFVKEADGDQVADDQPEWPISPHTNYVRLTGLQQLRDKKEALLARKAALQINNAGMSSKMGLNQVERELRYYNARINSAKLISIKDEDKHTVNIGATVKFIDEDNKSYCFTIVGEDEADIKDAKISWVSPLAKALLDRQVGEEVVWPRPAGDLYVEIEQISY